MNAAPRPNKTAGLHWTARPKLDLALMAESSLPLMGLIGQAWPDRPDMLQWINEPAISACPEGAVLGVGVRDLESLDLAICGGTAAASAPSFKRVCSFNATTLRPACSPPGRLRGAPGDPPASRSFGRPRFECSHLWHQRLLLLAAQALQRLLRVAGSVHL